MRRIQVPADYPTIAAAVAAARSFGSCPPTMSFRNRSCSGSRARIGSLGRDDSGDRRHRATLLHLYTGRGAVSSTVYLLVRNGSTVSFNPSDPIDWSSYTASLDGAAFTATIPTYGSGSGYCTHSLARRAPPPVWELRAPRADRRGTASRESFRQKVSIARLAPRGARLLPR